MKISIYLNLNVSHFLLFFSQSQRMTASYALSFVQSGCTHPAAKNFTSILAYQAGDKCPFSSCYMF